MTVHHSQTGRRAGTPIRRRTEWWRRIRRALPAIAPTHRKEHPHG